MRILVFGKNGQVGSELARLLSGPAQGDEIVLAGRAECDFSSPHAVRQVVQRVQPEVILNAAAYTAVDKAETERELCFAVNAGAPEVLAHQAAASGALLVHYSSDYVFNGEKPGPYLETDTTSPVSVYGESKASGEAAIAATPGRYLILRTSWVYAAQGSNFLRTMLRLGAQRPELRVVDDQVGSPTSAAAIALATLRLVKQYASAPWSLPAGIYHMTAEGSTSWCGFARAIFKAGAINPGPRVEAIASAQYPTPAKRPANSVLSNDKFAHTFGFRLPPWQHQLESVMAGLCPDSEGMETR